MDSALQIITELRSAGYIAYFAGGWVRDFLLKKKSPDIDIATSASPEQVVALFSHTVEVGISFGVVIVIVEGCSFEVATFRKDGLYIDGRHPEGVEYSTPEEDAKRRDFTINGMFYDPIEKKVLDFVGGGRDLKSHLIKAIGDARERFTEDRLRMLRAVRFMARFCFTIEKETKEAILALSHTLLPAVAIERVWQELCKMSAQQNFSKALIAMHELGLLQTIFPALTTLSREEIVNYTEPFIHFPPSTPTILYLLQLFPLASRAEIEKICHYLKVSVKDRQLALLYRQIIEAKDLITWIYLYAQDQTDLCLQVVAAVQGEHYLAKHLKMQREYSLYITHLREKKPLVNSVHLKALGIMPGKEMGELLRRAERLAITKKLKSSEQVLAYLKKDLPQLRERNCEESQA